MRIACLLAAGLIVTGCASAPPAPPVEKQVKLDASNIAEAQRAGYKMVTKDGQTLYCRKDLQTGSRTRYTTSCLTALELQQLREASQRGVEQVQRRATLPRGN